MVTWCEGDGVSVCQAGVEQGAAQETCKDMLYIVCQRAVVEAHMTIEHVAKPNKQKSW